MFPARAGMNRRNATAGRNRNHVPRTRGDEPLSLANELLPGLMFPARAGMNRAQNVFSALQYNVPRTRGDEPAEETARRAGLECSPHARG